VLQQKKLLMKIEVTYSSYFKNQTLSKN